METLFLNTIMKLEVVKGLNIPSKELEVFWNQEKTWLKMELSLERQNQDIFQSWTRNKNIQMHFSVAGVWHHSWI